MRPLHLRAAMVLAILSILALATPALAQKGFSSSSPKQEQRHRLVWFVHSRHARRGLRTCDFTFVSVVDGSTRFSSSDEGVTRSGSQACLDHQVSIQSDESFELVSLQSGCTDTFTLTTAADLSSAHWWPRCRCSTSNATSSNCEPVGDPIDTAVDVTWSADEVQTVREHFVSHSLQGDLWCSSNQTRRGLGAFGTATGTAAVSTLERSSSPRSSPAS